MAGPRIGHLLIRYGKITEEQLAKALERQKEKGGTLGSNLVELGVITDNDMNMALAAQLGFKPVDIDIEELDPEVVELIPADISMKFKTVAIEKIGNNLTVAITDPTNNFALDTIKMITGLKIDARICSESQITKVIEKFFDVSDSFSDVMKDIDAEDLEVVEEHEDEDTIGTDVNVDDAPLVRLVNSLLVDAVKRKASDIHIEPFERQMRVRFRIDGTLIP